MDQRWKDLEPEESEFVKRLQGGTIGARYGDCPPPSLLLAISEGIIEEDLRAGVMEHLKRCNMCQMLHADLASPDVGRLSEEAALRIDARLAHCFDRQPARSWRRWLRPAPAAAFAAIVLSVALGTYLLRRPPAEQVARTPQTVTKEAVEKPGIKLPAAALVFRGGAPAGQQQFIDDLGATLAPYRQDNYAEAARRLEALLARYPKAVAPRFYLGICLMFLERDAEAVDLLRQARQAPENDLSRDSAWYLGVALRRAGRGAEARPELEELCKTAGEHQARACAILGQPVAPTTRP